jgi:hypothetical protein
MNKSQNISRAKMLNTVGLDGFEWRRAPNLKTTFNWSRVFSNLPMTYLYICNTCFSLCVELLNELMIGNPILYDYN